MKFDIPAISWSRQASTTAQALWDDTVKLYLVAKCCIIYDVQLQYRTYQQICMHSAISRDRAFYVIASYPESDVLTCSWYAEDDRG